MGREKLGEVKLDLKDKKLLFELDFNARQSISQLAKKLNLSKQGVDYKLQRLLREEVITGFHPVINMNRLGYRYCRLIFSMRNANIEKEKEILDYLINESKFFWIFTTQGIYDFGMAMWAKSITDFEKEIKKLYDRYGYFINEKNETVATDVIYLQNRYFMGINKTKEIHVAETNKILKIDKVDEEILKALSENARMSSVKIAERVGESPKVVAYRIKKLEKKKIIEGYRADINHKKLGFTWYKLWIDSRKISKEIMEQIKNDPHVSYIIKGIGMPGEIDIEVMVKESQDLYNFIKNLRNNFPDMIGSYEPLIMIKMEKIKYVSFKK